MSRSGAYYNEFDPKAAAWLRELIKQGHISDGEVDGRSIVDVSPDELRGFTQCHFFAGIGVWSYALRSAGWADDRQVWTGSCPCQPFSAAGAGGGFDDERHLWPHWHHLISQCQPAIVFGEQVASKDGLNWLDLVHADLEATGYAVGAADMCAAGLGAPHIRQRLWFVGLADASLEQHDGAGFGRARGRAEHTNGGAACGLGDGNVQGLEGQRGGHQDPVGRDGALRPVAEAGQSGGLADATGGGHQYVSGDGGLRTSDDGEAAAAKQRGVVCTPSRLADASGLGRGESRDGHHCRDDGPQLDADGGDGRPSPTDGFWRDADWLFCRDGKWRPVEPGTFPLAHGSAARVGRLRGYGNAIAAPVAQAFIESVMEITQ